MHEIYAKASPPGRPKMQTGVVREILCPDGWPKDPRTLIATLVACSRFQHEDTCHAYTIKAALMALVVEMRHDGSLRDAAFDRRTLEPWTPADAQNARRELLRLCDWIESRLHYLTHSAWYGCPDCFSNDPEEVHLANIGVAQRHLARFSERDRKRWEAIHERAVAKHHGDLKKWGVVGKVQHDPRPRTWSHPAVDAHIIVLWPLVLRFNWTYSDLLNVLERSPAVPADSGERRYPLDCVESLKVHCRTFCGLTKPGKGRSTGGLPSGWQIAEQLFHPMGK
ncbi:MAG: hypothetical protein ACKVYV_06020 [Limisphaerales bacterium]